ncbi:isocitrate lyase/phosphoenolpyruvate mutase family protein, partial [Streptomyces sp. KR55]|uniref:isocitrate lyase/phosphoenolpyruvate mutase family protein n=1 Tax=Streptomyces sp. KR55 TaxID=3457425 RepID=UPI003FD598A5
MRRSVAACWSRPDPPDTPWALGAPDGDRLERDRALTAVAGITAAVGVPVTADIESGYAPDAEGVADTVR